MTAQERKIKTETFLAQLNVPVNIYLPTIEEEDEVNLRTAQDIAKRILILTYLNYLADEDNENGEVLNFLKTENLWDAISQDEEKLFLKKNLSKKEKFDISWRSECIWLMLWAIKKVETLDLPIEECDIPEILERIPQFLSSTSDFIRNARLRITSELLDMSDLIYRVHWAARQAEIDSKEPPCNLNSSIIYERHYAINWITYYEDNWDEITTDT